MILSKTIPTYSLSFYEMMILCCSGLGQERDRTTQRGRFQVVPRVPVRMRTGGAQLSGRILEGGVVHC